MRSHHRLQIGCPDAAASTRATASAQRSFRPNASGLSLAAGKCQQRGLSFARNASRRKGGWHGEPWPYPDSGLSWRRVADGR
jgi:hypothetical protein